VESLPAKPNQVREAYQNSATNSLNAKALEAQERHHNEQAKTPESKALFQQATTTGKLAKRNEVKARTNFEKQGKQHNTRFCSLSQTHDTTFQSHKITKEHCHGGKHNGVNCIKIMEKAEELFTAFASEIKLKKIPTVGDEVINSKCHQHANLLGLLDKIWSNVRGIDAGLLPTQLQLESLEKATSKAKALWLQMELGTKQPKWHMTLDGHLLHQVKFYGGIADKSNESIELQHQVIMKLKDQFRRVTSYQRRERCIRKELRRGKSPEIKSHIDNYQAAIKRKPTTKRALDTACLPGNRTNAKLNE